MEKEILPEREEDEKGTPGGGVTPAEVKLRELELKLELQKLEWKHRECKQRVKLEQQRLEMEKDEGEYAIRLKERAGSTPDPERSPSKEFNLGRKSRLVLPFNEKEMDVYFAL